MKQLNAISLSILLAASSAAFAGSEGVVHFNGHVNEPTCAVISPKQNITLDTIGAAELQAVQIGQSIEKGSKQFNINLDCEAANLQDHIVLRMNGNADAGQVQALSNAADSNNGVGLEVFYADRVLKPNEAIPGALFNNLNNKGSDNLTMTVRYARTAEEVKGGNVESDVTFVSEYR